MGVLVHGQHQAAHRQQRLPHFMVALHTAQSVLPHLASQRSSRFCSSLIACKGPSSTHLLPTPYSFMQCAEFQMEHALTNRQYIVSHCNRESLPSIASSMQDFHTAWTVILDQSCASDVREVCTLGQLECQGVLDGLFKLGQLLHTDHILVCALIALPYQSCQLLTQQVPRPLNANCMTQLLSELGFAGCE